MNALDTIEDAQRRAALDQLARDVARNLRPAIPAERESTTDERCPLCKRASKAVHA